MTATARTVWLLAACSLSALVLSDFVAVVAFVSVLVSAGIDAWLVRHEPELEQETPHMLWRGEPAQLTVSGPAARSVEVRQPSNADIALSPESGVGGLDSSVVALRRGRHHLPRPAVRSVGPLRLGAWNHRAGTPRDVIVYPDMPSAYAIAAEVQHGRFRDEGQRSRGPLGLGTDFESIRHYQPDDDIRQVNWKASARVGVPMSNVWRVEQDREVICLVDAGRLMAAPVGDMTRLDAAVDAVAAMAAVADIVGDRVGVVAFTDKVNRRVSPKRASGKTVVRAIYDLEPRDVDSNYELAFRLVAASKHSFLLILTDLLDQGAAAPLLDGMAVLAKHHSVAVAAVQDEDVYGAATGTPESASDSYRMAAALDVLESRRLVVAQLTRMGAQVIEAPLESFSRRCVGAYLRSRRGARL